MSWFNLAEANFHLRNITKRDTKFWYVVSKLDPETLQKLSSFLAKSRGDDPYVEIHAILCKTYEPKLEQKLDTLLASSDIGDKHPAEYALELRHLLSNATVNNILKRLFVRVLPKHLVNPISGNLDDSFDALVEVDDKVWVLSASICMTIAVIGILAPTVTPTHGRGEQIRTSRRPACQESRSVVLCLFHLKWGDSARKCLPSCFRWDPRPPTTGFPGQGYWQGHQHGLGKLAGWLLSAAVTAVPASLGLVVDGISGRSCLLESGSQDSLWQASHHRIKIRSSNLRLVAANATPINAFGTMRQEIKIRQ